MLVHRTMGLWRRTMASKFRLANNYENFRCVKLSVQSVLSLFTGWLWRCRRIPAFRERILLPPSWSMSTRKTTVWIWWQYTKYDVHGTPSVQIAVMLRCDDVYFGTYRGADKSLARPGRKQANVSVRMAWISFGALPCRKRNLMTVCVSILLKSCASVTCFPACFLSGRAKDLPAPRYY